MKKINQMRLALPIVLVLASVAYLGLYLASHLLAPGHAGASEAPNGSLSSKFLGQGDYVWNWDFNGNKVKSDAVDWGMRFIFYNNASIDKVKDRLDGKGGDPSITPVLNKQGGFQYAAMDDHETARAWKFDGNRGIKRNPGCEWNEGHIRIYATGSNNRNFNTTYGFYVVATTHRDHESLFGCDNQYLSTETNEDWWIDRIEDNLGSDTDYNWTVYDRSFNWDNGVTGIPEISPDASDDHWYQSDGWGASVHIPDDN